MKLNQVVTLLLSTLLSFGVLAQSKNAKLIGKVIDSTTQKGVFYATVTLHTVDDDKTLDGTLADEQGDFSIDKLKPGNYNISISFIGYKTMTFTDYSLKPGDNNLGVIEIEMEASLLDEVIVHGDRPIIENKIDRIIFNAERDVTSSGGDATDVLRKVPMLSVDIDGNVSLRGEQNVKILINGKSTGAMANNAGDALRTIPADQIKSVEVITNPSAKHDAEGTSGIINIITKKKDVGGISGSISGGIGTRHNNGNANFNARKDKLGVVANLGGNYMWPQIVTNDFEQFTNEGKQTLRQFNEQKTTRSGLRGSIGLDYDLSKKDLLTTTFSSNWFEMGKNGFTNSTFFSDLDADLYLASDKQDKTASDGFDWSADYTRKFENPLQELSFSGQFSRSTRNTDYTTIYTEGNNFDETGTNKGLNDELSFQADYIQPIGKTILELGAKTIFRNITSTSLVEEELNGIYETAEDRSYEFNYKQDVIAGYATYGFEFAEKYEAKAGVRIEHTMLNGNDVGDFDAFKNDYTKILPSAIVLRKFGRMTSLKLSYNQRIQRPSLFFLNPFRNASDPVVHQQGNPELKPELSHNIELGYSTFKKGTVVNVSLFYRRTNDVIESLNQIDSISTPGQNVSLRTFDNIGVNESFGTNLFVSFSPIKNLTIRTNVSLFTYEAKSNQFNKEFSTQTGKIHFMYRAFINGSYQIGKGFIAETFVMLNSPRRTFQGISPSMNMWTIGVKKEFWNKTASLGINMTNPFWENTHFKTEVNTPNYTQVNEMVLPFRSFGLTFSYNFGKSEIKNKPSKERGIKNEDQKQGESEPGMN